MIYLSLAYSVASFWYLVEMSGPEASVAVIIRPLLTGLCKKIQMSMAMVVSSLHNHFTFNLKSTTWVNSSLSSYICGLMMN